MKKILVAVSLVLLMLFTFLAYAYMPDSLTTVITGTNSKNINSVDTYIVLTPAGIMTNHDVVLFKYRSDEVQEKAERLKGKEVIIKKYGIDIPFLSIRENILSINKVNKTTDRGVN